MYSDKLEIHIIELPKLKKKEHPKTELLNWARFLNAESKEEMKVAAKTDPYITKAYEKLIYISADEEKRLEYEAREKAIRDYNWQMKSNYRQGRQEGKAEDILDLLADKGVIPETIKEQILKEQDLLRLKSWLRLAAKVESVEAFAEGMQG